MPAICLPMKFACLLLGLAEVGACLAAEAVGPRACASLVRRVDAVAGGAPLLLRSYDAASGSGAPDEPALRTAAFTYDNALAVVALLGCGQPAQASRIAEALRLASAGERLPNALRAGAVDAAPLPNGWWDAAANRWAEDRYQAGTATGNVAWTMLALLAMRDATDRPGWLDATRVLGRWVIDHASTAGDGFDGGLEGFGRDTKRQTWKSTEHNIDLAAAFAWLESEDPADAARWREAAARARRFVESMWDAKAGCFLVGTLPDGATPNRTMSALDVQLWAQLLPQATPDWRRAIAYAQSAHAVKGGFDFNADRDGLWLEGTAQAALVLRVLDRDRDADPLFETLASQFSPGGLIYATREPRVSTGLALGSDSKTADFFYQRLPHLGATAWAALAALRRNPFVPPPRATPH